MKSSPDKQIIFSFFGFSPLSKLIILLFIFPSCCSFQNHPAIVLCYQSFFPKNFSYNIALISLPIHFLYKYQLLCELCCLPTNPGIFSLQLNKLFVTIYLCTNLLKSFSVQSKTKVKNVQETFTTNPRHGHKDRKR